MSLLDDILKVAVAPILSAAGSLADAAVDGATLGKKGKQALWTAYNIAMVHGDDIVESTENEYDNAALKVLAEFCADTLAEAGIIVPVIPDALLESEPDVPNVVSGDVPDA